MRKIIHLPLRAVPGQMVKAPEGTQFLGIAEEGGIPVIVALADGGATELLDYPIAIRGRGHQLPQPEGRYLGWIHDPDGSPLHVFHIGSGPLYSAWCETVAKPDVCHQRN